MDPTDTKHPPQYPYPAHWPTTTRHPLLTSASASYLQGAQACGATASQAAYPHADSMQAGSDAASSLTLWEQTQVETEELFYRTFPAARQAAQSASHWHYHTSQGFFEGTTFSYGPSAPDYGSYGAMIAEDTGCTSTSRCEASQETAAVVMGSPYPYNANTPPSLRAHSSWTVADLPTHRHDSYGTETSTRNEPFSPSEQPPPHRGSLSIVASPVSQDIEVLPTPMIVPSQGHLVGRRPRIVPGHRHDEEPFMDSLSSDANLSSPVVSPTGEPSYPNTPSSYGSPGFDSVTSEPHHPTAMRFSDPPQSGHWPGYETAPAYPSDTHDSPILIKSESPEPTRHSRRNSNRHSRSLSRHQGSSRQHRRSPHRSPSPRAGLRISPLPSNRRSQAPERKPPLACLFCRGRKIACGPPLPGSKDKTCNQCQRRSLKCEYPLESRRGMRKKRDIADKITEDGPKVVITKSKH